MTDPPESALSLHEVSKRYRSVAAVDGLSLRARPGELITLIGPSGCGKTTTLRMVAGLLRPDAGQVWVGGHDTWADTLTVRRLIGVVPDPLNLFDRLTARELLGHLGELRGLDAAEVARRSEELLAVMDLTGAADEQVGGYSHGMRKKTAIAAALLHRPAVLLLDEPFEGVDPVSAVAVRTILDRYRRSGGTVVFSSHAMDLVDRMCDVVAVMVDGALLAAGPIEQLRGGGRLEDAFISMVGASPVDPASIAWLDRPPT